MNFHKHKEEGAATLGIALILILIISIGAFASANVVLNDTKGARNEVVTLRALNSADAGINYAMSWLGVPANTSDPSFVWTATSDPATNVNGKTLTISNDGFTVTMTFYRQLVASQNFTDASPTGLTTQIIQIVAVATGETSASAQVSQKVYLPTVINNSFSGSPIVVQGCLSGVTGSPNVSGVPNNMGDITTSANSATNCINPGSLGSIPVQLGGFTGTAWDYTFGISQAQMKAAAGDNSGTSVRYYDSSSPLGGGQWNSDFGSATSPGIIVFMAGSDGHGGCPKVNGGPTIYGIVYYDAGCGGNEGWGNATVNGSVVNGGDITQLTANTNFNYTNLAGNPALFQIPVTAVRVVGSWKDF